jgi:predicted LPLAT superfamily acyltransferase
MSQPTASAQEAQPAAWSRRGIGQPWQFRFFNWLLRVGGTKHAYRMSYVVTFWYALLYPSIRKRCGFYLSRRFPQRRGPLQRFWDTYRLVRSFGTTLVDMAALSVLGPETLSAFSPDHDRLMALCAGEKGYLLLHAHLGGWQVGMSTLRQYSKHVSIVMIPEPRTTAMFDPQNASIIDPRTGLEGVMRMTEALLAGQIVTMMGDRTFGDEQNTVSVRFLGGTTKLPVTPYRLASATGVPVVVMLAPKTGGNSYELRLAKVIEVPPNLGRAAAEYAPYAQQFADCLEEFVRQYPWQFYNFYDLWAEASAT